MFLNYNNLFAFFRVKIILILITSMIYKTKSMPTHTGNFCLNTTMFANGSTYQTNLNTVFRNLVSNATNNPSGFYRTTVGNPTVESVYGQYLCRGDQNIISCHQCVVTAATTDLPKTYCPNRKIAVIWYDECMVRYSNVSFFNTMDQSPTLSYKNRNNITGNSTQFMEILGNMMNNVIAVRVPEGGPVKKFAVDSVKYSIFENIYGLGQCTPDLSPNDCYQCLISCFGNFDQAIGFRVMTPSCLVRYELYPFFNLSFLPESPLSTSTASDSNPVLMPSAGSKVKLGWNSPGSKIPCSAPHQSNLVGCLYPEALLYKLRAYYWNTNNIIGDINRFMNAVANMFSNVIAVQAAGGGSFKKFATDFVNYSAIQPIYGLGQCTPNLIPNDCYQCLNSSIHQFHQKPGGRVLTPSCVIRFEAYPFFNLSYLPQAPPPSLSPLPSPSPASDSKPIAVPSDSNGKKKISTKVIVAIIIAVLLVFSVALCLICVCVRLLKNKPRGVDVSTHAETSNQDFTVDSLQYDLATLLKATNNFSDENKLGEGGFGGVYKGTLSNGKLIAVKRLSASSSQGIQEFKTEVLVVAKLQHRNLVRLLGFCYTEHEKLLVYEYFPNKSLDNFIFDQENRQQLNWDMHYNIIRGIARGLLYLHHDSQLRIIHRDLKASNILLDKELNPKISDFGTSRIFGVDHSQSNYTNKVVGTYGYMAPEYALQGQFSIKSDAYSFGVLVLEIISGRKVSTFNQDSDSDDLLSDAWRQWEAGTPLEFVDPIIRDSCSNNTDVKRCMQLALLCVQESVEDRPTMANVVLTLDSYSITLPVPDHSDFFARPRVITSFPPMENNNSDHSSSKSIPLSVNEDSVTELEPRRTK